MLCLSGFDREYYTVARRYEFYVWDIALATRT